MSTVMGTAGEHRRGRAEGDARGHLVGAPRRPEPAGEGEVIAWLGERPDHGARARGRRRCSSALRSCGPGTASGRADRTGARRPGVLGENSMAREHVKRAFRKNMRAELLEPSWLLACGNCYSSTSVCV